MNDAFAYYKKATEIKETHKVNDDDLQLKSYQDDLTTDDTPDPFMDENGEDPSEELGVPANELKEELDKRASGADDEIIDDDEREYIEDLDEDSEDRA